MQPLDLLSVRPHAHCLLSILILQTDFAPLGATDSASWLSTCTSNGSTAKELADASSYLLPLPPVPDALQDLALEDAEASQPGIDRKEGTLDDITPVSSSETEHVKNQQEICADCVCQDAPTSAIEALAAGAAQPSLRREPITSESANGVGLYFFDKIVLDGLRHPAMLTEEIQQRAWATSLSCPDNTFAYNLIGLTPGLPTLYMYTRSGPGGRLAGIRPKYFNRHVETIKDYQRAVQQRGHLDGTPADSRQLLWTVIEDSFTLNEDLLELLKSSGVNFIYFTLGRTYNYGNTQWNAAWGAVNVLHKTFGDGPVLNVDDDSRIMPELLMRVWKVCSASA